MTFDPETEGPHLAQALEYFQYQLKGISFLPHRAFFQAVNTPPSSPVSHCSSWLGAPKSEPPSNTSPPSVLMSSCLLDFFGGGGGDLRATSSPSRLSGRWKLPPQRVGKKGSGPAVQRRDNSVQADAIRGHHRGAVPRGMPARPRGPFGAGTA